MDIEQSYHQPDGMVSIFSIACVPLTPVPTFAGMQCKGPWLVQYRVKYSGSSTVLVSAIRLFTREVPIHWVIVNCTIICNSAVHEQGTSIAGARVVIDARAGVVGDCRITSFPYLHLLLVGFDTGSILVHHNSFFQP